MLWNATEQQAREIAARIVELADPDTVLLFGSVARGTALQDASDIDLAVVWPDNGEPRRTRLVRLRQPLGLLSVPLDIVSFTRDEWAAEVISPISLAHAILQEGKVLYERLH